METQNVTTSLSRRALLRKVKHLAVEKEKSISRLLVEALEEMVRHNDAYEQALRALAREHEESRDLGLGDKIPWTRDELHERR